MQADHHWNVYFNSSVISYIATLIYYYYYILEDSASSSSEDSEGEGDELEREASDKEKTSVPLPLPDLDRLTSPSATPSSVFSNPYKEAEEAKLAILKRHVSELAPDEKPSPQHHRTKCRKQNRAVARGRRGFTEATPTGDAIVSVSLGKTIVQ